MKITKFKLIRGGAGGMSIVAREYRTSKQDGHTLMAEDVTRRSYNATDETFKIKINKLKYFFLQLTGHWDEDIDKFFDKDTYKPVLINGDLSKFHEKLHLLLNKTRIVGATRRKNDFTIIGEVEQGLGEKRLTITTVPIVEDDDPEFYENATGILDDIFNHLTRLFESDMSINIPSEIKEKIVKASDVELTHDEIMDQYITMLEKEGHIVISPEPEGDRKFSTEKVSAPVSVLEAIDEVQLDIVNLERDQQESDKLQAEPEEKVNIFDNQPDFVEKKKSGKKTKAVMIDIDILEDEDIKEIIGMEETKEIPDEKFVVTRHKQINSTIASEKDFSQIMANREKEEVAEVADLSSAEFSGEQPVNIDDEWGSSAADSLEE